MNKVNISNIVRGIVVNEGGITLTLENNILDRKVYKSGYQVSIEDVFITDASEPLKESQWDELFKHLQVVEINQIHQPAIGAWFDEETNKIHWDISVNVPNPRTAYFLAVNHDQIAIYDWKNKCSYDKASFANLINKEVL